MFQNAALIALVAAATTTAFAAPPDAPSTIGPLPPPAPPPEQSGHDGAFRIAGPGGDRLTVGGYMQFRYIIKDQLKDAEPDSFNAAFVNERVRLIFAGHLEEPGIDFLLLPYTGANGQWGFLDIWSRFRLGDEWTLSLGQFKLPFMREWLVSERYIMAVERSIVSDAYSSVYSQGLLLEGSPAEDVHLKFAFSDGLRAFDGANYSGPESDYAFTARAELLLDGPWSAFKDISSVGNSASAAMIGLAAHHQGETSGLHGFDVDSLSQVTLDASWEGEGASLMGAVVARHIDRAGGDDTVDFGAMVQGGVFVSDDVEAFARAAALVPDDDAEEDDVFTALTAGVNWYVHGHALRVGLDAEYYPDPPSESDVAGFRPGGSSRLTDAPDSQIVVRLEVQILF